MQLSHILGRDDARAFVRQLRARSLSTPSLFPRQASQAQRCPACGQAVFPPTAAVLPGSLPDSAAW
ncbi:zinc ribbon domain-containing protein [Xanthomonas campestris]|uniref:zinc ribbon domain-containing protein n=1 Tax=Xanthomonas campestris TaxID=339 RepID=UPI003CFCFF1F